MLFHSASFRSRIHSPSLSPSVVYRLPLSALVTAAAHSSPVDQLRPRPSLFGSSGDCCSAPDASANPEAQQKAAAVYAISGQSSVAAVIQQKASLGRCGAPEEQRDCKCALPYCFGETMSSRTSRTPSSSSSSSSSSVASRRGGSGSSSSYSSSKSWTESSKGGGSTSSSKTGNNASSSSRESASAARLPESSRGPRDTESSSKQRASSSSYSYADDHGKPSSSGRNRDSDHVDRGGSRNISSSGDSRRSSSPSHRGSSSSSRHSSSSSHAASRHSSSSSPSWRGEGSSSSRGESSRSGARGSSPLSHRSQDSSSGRPSSSTSANYSRGREGRSAVVHQGSSRSSGFSGERASSRGRSRSLIGRDERRRSTSAISDGRDPLAPPSEDDRGSGLDEEPDIVYSSIAVIQNVPSRCSEEDVEERVRSVAISKGFSVPNGVTFAQLTLPELFVQLGKKNPGAGARKDEQSSREDDKEKEEDSCCNRVMTVAYVDFPSADAAAKFSRSCRTGSLFLAHRHCPVHLLPERRQGISRTGKYGSSKSSGAPGAGSDGAGGGGGPGMAGDTPGEDGWTCSQCRVYNPHPRLVCMKCCAQMPEGAAVGKDGGGSRRLEPGLGGWGFDPVETPSAWMAVMDLLALDVEDFVKGLRRAHRKLSGATRDAAKDASTREKSGGAEKDSAAKQLELQRCVFVKDDLKDGARPNNFLLMRFPSPEAALDAWKCVKSLVGKEVGNQVCGARAQVLTRKEKQAMQEMLRLVEKSGGDDLVGRGEDKVTVTRVRLKDLKDVAKSSSTYEQLLQQWQGLLLPLAHNIPPVLTTLDEKSGYYYDASIDLYLDPSTNYYMTSAGDYYIHDTHVSALRRVCSYADQQQLQAAENNASTGNPAVSEENPSTAPAWGSSNPVDTVASLLAAAKKTAKASKAALEKAKEQKELDDELKRQQRIEELKKLEEQHRLKMEQKQLAAAAAMSGVMSGVPGVSAAEDGGVVSAGGASGGSGANHFGSGIAFSNGKSIPGFASPPPPPPPSDVTQSLVAGRTLPASFLADATGRLAQTPVATSSPPVGGGATPGLIGSGDGGGERHTPGAFDMRSDRGGREDGGFFKPPFLRGGGRGRAGFRGRGRGGTEGSRGGRGGLSGILGVPGIFERDCGPQEDDEMDPTGRIARGGEEEDVKKVKEGDEEGRSLRDAEAPADKEEENDIFVCYLCLRKFADKEKLALHEEKSKLHAWFLLDEEKKRDERAAKRKKEVELMQVLQLQMA